MILTHSLKICLAIEPRDMRKSFDGLAAIVRNELKEEPASRQLFVFSNRQRNRVKILYWDGTGFWVLANRHAPQCAYRFVFEDPLSVSSSFWERLRDLWVSWRQTGHGLRAASGPVVLRRAGVDVRSGSLRGSENG